MKLSISKWVSAAILLPLITVILNIATPAGAEQIDRSRVRVSESNSPTLDLNLSIPTDDEQPPSSPAPASSRRRNLTATNTVSTAAAVEPVVKHKSIRRRKDVATNLNSSESIPPIIEQSKPVQPIYRRQYAATNIDATGATPQIDRSRRNRKRIAAVSPPPLSGNYLRLVRDPSRGSNNIGNPIYTLELYIGGEISQRFNAVSGTYSTQNLDRNRGMNHAPLPDGLYRVSDQIVPGALPEVGRTFVGIYPQFDTNRSDLGIHLDPSFNQRRSDGTSGCIGLTTAADRDALNEFVLKHHPRNLYVSIMPDRDR